MLSQPSSPTYYARLQFMDAATCVDWLESVPLADTTTAHEMVAAQLGLLARTDLALLERLRILEVLYRPAVHLQSELARRFTGRALPLSIVEYSIWNSVLELWQALFAGYATCARSFESGEAAAAHLAPLVALRTIDITGAEMREHHRAYREIPQDLWARLHECFAAAEQHGAAAVRVSDPLDAATPARTPLAAYASILLAQLANPYAMSARQMIVTYRWAAMWSPLIAIERLPPPPGMTGVLAVDLNVAKPPVPARQMTVAPSVRYIVMEALGRTLRRMLMALRDGQLPAGLGLGEDCRQPATERLLTLLYVQWCGAGTGQLESSHEPLEDARACVGFAAVLRQLEAQAEVFRIGASGLRTTYAPLTEQWNVFSVRSPGFVGVTRGPECDERIRHHQLVAIKRRSGTGFQLAVTQWLKLEDDGELAIGLRIWAGTPRILRIRIADDDEAVAMAAIAMPAVPELRLPETIVLEPGVFQPGLPIEFAVRGACRARLTRLTERGADFERSAYELID